MIAGTIHPFNRIRVGTRAIRTGTHHDAMFRKCPQRIQPLTSLAENIFQVFIRFLRPIDKCALYRQQNMIFLTDIDTFFRRQAGMDNGMSVIFPRIIIQSRFQSSGGLIKSRITDGMHLYLQSGTIGLFAEFCHLRITVVQNTFAVAVLIRHTKRCIL